MTVSEVKETLRAVRDTEQAYRLAKSKAENLEKLLMCGKGQKTDKLSPNEKRENPVENAYCTLADEKSEADRLLQEMISARKKADMLIGTVSDPNQREVLTRRYIIGEKWELIAENMNYDIKWVYKLHRRALEKLTIESDY